MQLCREVPDLSVLQGVRSHLVQDYGIEQLLSPDQPIQTSERQRNKHTNKC